MPGRGPITSAIFLGVLLTVALAATGCGRGDDDSGESPAPATPPTASETAAPRSPTEQGFRADVKKVTAGDLKSSWRSGCPVAPSGLRMIEMTYWGMDDKPHTGGRLVVNAKAADDLVSVFKKLYDVRYPIERMEPVDKYGGSDFDSIEANNTSAFNCRNATGSSSFSQHAYGLAVDINPCQNPYVYADGHIAHKSCTKYKNRDLDAPGMIHAGDKVVDAFDAIGWGWGGTWSGAKDYQHFSSSGR
ncbi:M15 family metallopeptidase [Actinomadura sp. BRA 177]|uniref:M15 family metallopeptidase n=1 Tax=Actinomadura sp. BRA 177 TaxID=2745202 RepID=UPI0015956C3A|nr:M15 family metallopeptidase [Actinomadura sp. BRA 177]NVI92527.1 M15 family metallopeptidase [Actinomadura sp. BRA 177]